MAYIRRQFSGHSSYSDALLSGITNSSTAITLKDGTTFPDGSVGPFVVTIDPGNALEEKVLVTTRSGANLQSCTRAYDGTTAQVHAANAVVEHTISAVDLDEANQAVHQLLGGSSTSGQIPYVTGAGTYAFLPAPTTGQLLGYSAGVPGWIANGTFVPLASATAPGTAPKEYWVTLGSAASDANSGDRYSPFATLAHAITVGNATAVSYTIHLGAGTFPLAAGVAPTVTNGAITIEGQGVGVTVIQVANATFTKNGVIFNLTGTGSTFTFDKLTIDGNGTNQSWGTSGVSDYYKAISGDANSGTTNGNTLVVGDLAIINQHMNATAPQGLGIDTFGLSTWVIGTLVTDTCDVTLFVTQSQVTTPNRGSFGRIIAHNPSNAAVIDEGGFGGPGWHGASLLVYLDALCGAQIHADAVSVGLGAASSGIVLDRLTLVNGRYPINAGGNALSDSHFGKCVAVGCRGSYNLPAADGTCTFSQLTADGCAIGGVTGTTVFASFEVGGVAGDACTVQSLICNNSQNGAIQGLGGPVRILGGRIKNGTTTVAINTPAGSAIRGVQGYNPVGVVTVAVPSSGVAVAAQAYDRTFYVSTVAGTTACSMAIQGGPTITFVGAVAQVVAVRVPAGQTVTPTYTGTAPTWVVEGE